MKKQVIDKIRKLRLDKGISQENVANELGITHSAYAKIERGETDPNLSRLFDLAKIFNVSVSAFFADESALSLAKEPIVAYGADKKEAMEQLNLLIPQLLAEIASLRQELARKA